MSGTIWFVNSCPSIGGAERRAVNLAQQVKSEAPEMTVKLLIRRSLFEELRKDSQLRAVLDAESLEVEVVEYDTPPALSRGSAVFRLMRNGRRALVKLSKRTIRRLGFAAPDNSRPATKAASFRDALVRKSWMQPMLDVTAPGDKIHCFVGDQERNGGILLSCRERRVVIEITSNRMIEKTAKHMRVILENVEQRTQLHIQCVSKTVYSNFLSEIGQDFLGQHGISSNYYRSPCLPLAPNRIESREPRQNVIVFGHRFVGPKNGKLFARVVSSMSGAGELSGWRVLLRGWGPEEAELREILAADIEAGVVEIGWSSDLDDDLSRSRIFVSIIATGSYPSQSLFQAMRNGNILLLGDAGETKERFEHPDVVFSEISESAVRSSLLQAMRIGNDKVEFERVSLAMSRFFDEFASRSTQAKELLELHFPSSVTTE